MGYRQSGYNAEFEGSFTSDDAQLNTLWTKARDTLYVTMRDTFMDCPDRERTQWLGDGVNEMQMASYSLSTDSKLLSKKLIGNILGYAGDKGELPTIAPSEKWYELPAQSLAGVMSFYMYYLYNGDEEVINEAYGPSCKYLMLFDMNDNGVVKNREGNWNWSDWGDNCDQDLIINAWYYIALDRTIKMSEVIGVSDNDKQVQELKTRKKSIEENFDKVFWNSDGYYRSKGLRVTDDRGNAMAVIAGLAKKENYPQIRQVLTTQELASPYMEKYVLEALFKMGYDNDAYTRMRSRYSSMINSSNTTLMEC
ncbi:MAG: hypothetical protein ACK5LL_16565 [Suipraeoptans sp.]